MFLVGKRGFIQLFLNDVPLFFYLIKEVIAKPVVQTIAERLVDFGGIVLGFG
jgi:hypothetical protein